MANRRNAASELVDVLSPPDFEASGERKPRLQAYEDGDWVRTFNLWIVQKEPLPAFVYQQRSMVSKWEPGKLDVSAGGHYCAGEALLDGLREAEEELGVLYDTSEITHVGRRLNISPDTRGISRRNVVEIFLVRDDRSLSSYRLDPREVSAICVCPLVDLERIHFDANYSFAADAVNSTGLALTLVVSAKSFPYNADDYHARMVHVASSFLSGTLVPYEATEHRNA